MNRIILRALNFPIFLIMVTLGVALQTTLFSVYPLHYFQPDVILIVAIWCALRRTFLEGGVFTLLAAEIAEIHSSVPQGVFLLSYMLIYLGVRLTSRVVVIPNRTSLVTLTLFASLIWKLLILLALYLLGSAANQWRHTLLMLMPGALAEGVLALWAYQWLERFDWITYKNMRARQALEDEPQLDPDWEEWA